MLQRSRRFGLTEPPGVRCIGMIPPNVFSHALIAGGGALPDALLQALRDRGEEPLLCGFVDNLHRADIAVRARLDRPGALFRTLRRRGVHRVTLCGTLLRPDLRRIRPDFTLLKHLPRLLRALRGGDDGLMRAVIGIFEREGFTVPPPEEVAPDLLMPRGALTRCAPGADDLKDILRGAQVLHAVGPLDIGQGCVIAGRRVLCLEAAEGTDALLARVCDLPVDRRGRGGVFVKAPKPGQDRRADLPTVGLHTVAGVVAAGLRGLALQAGGVYTLERASMIAAAEAAGVFIYGFDPCT